MTIDFIAGCLGGLAGVLVGHPLDTVKVRLQTQDAANPRYKGTFHCFTSTIKQESVAGLYKGIRSPMYGLVAINGIVFGVQGAVQRRMADPDRLSSHFIAGSVAGAFQSFICSPMEMAKTRMQTQGQGARLASNTLYDGPVDCLLKIHQVEGIRGVFRGFGLTVLREAPSFGVYFLAYEYICRLFDKGNGTQLNTAVLLFSGGIAGQVSWISTYPVDVVKSRVQNDIANEYKGAMDCVRKSFAKEGLGFFWRGIGATLVRAFPMNGATFAAVTWVLRLSDQYWPKDDPSVPISQLSGFEKHKYQHHYHVHNHEVESFSCHP